MEQGCDVKLLGFWYSPPCARVELALKFKGIPYDYIEQDLTNKSDLLLKSNPVHHKVPVLLHHGRPIAESLIILEYTDDCWKDSPKLLPDDPNERAKLRFWASYFDQKYWPSMIKILESSNGEREKAMEEFSEMIKVLEEGIWRDLPPLYPHNPVGYLDIVVGSGGCSYRAFFEGIGLDCGDVVATNQRYFSWMDALRECPLLKETLPPHHKLVTKIKETYNKNPKS